MVAESAAEQFVMENMVILLLIFLSLASFLFFAILDLSKDSKLLHRYCSIVLLILFIFSWHFRDLPPYLGQL
jgi:hypothetical protein